MQPDHAHALLLPEELLLLALDDTEGNVLPEARLSLDFGLAGALLMELAQRGDLHIEGSDRLTVRESAAAGPIPLMDAVRALLRAQPGKDAAYWIHHLPHSLRDMRQQLIDDLVTRGMLQLRETRVLFMFSVQRFPELDGGTERDIRRRIDTVLLHGDTPDARTALLIQLAHSCRLVRAMYPAQQRAAIEARVEALGELAVADDVDAATRAAISAAAMAGAMAAITAATAASTNAVCTAAGIC